MASRPVSRLPRHPSTGQVPTTSKLAPKRTASTAQLDPDIEHALTRRQAKVDAFTSTMAKSTLERRVVDAEQARKLAETDLAKIKAEKVKVENDRRYFSEREKELEEELEKERAEHEEERVSLRASFVNWGANLRRCFQNANTLETKRLRAALERLQKQYNEDTASQDQFIEAARTATREVQAAKSKASLLEQQNEHLRGESERLRSIQHEDQEQCRVLQDQLDQKSQGRLSENDWGEVEQQWEVLKNQLSKQTQLIRTLEESNSKMRAELLVLRERKMNVEVLKEEKRVLESKVRDADDLRQRVGLLESQLDILERENRTG